MEIKKNPLNQITLLDENGQVVCCDVLFTFDSEDTKKSYIVYTDQTRDEEGNVEVCASIYAPEENGGRLYPIQTEEEWEVIEAILDLLTQKMR